MSNWEPKEGSRGCSEAFHNNDFIESNQGLAMIKNETASLIENDSDDLDAPAIFKVCRVCLAMDVKMYYMTDHNLQQIYEQTTATGILLDDDKLPQMFCWECAQRLINGSKFRTKAWKTQILLTEIFNSYKCITIEHIKSVNRVESHLISSLIKTSNVVNDFDVEISISDDDIKSELVDSRDAFDENTVSQESEESTEKGLEEIELKDEPIFNACGSDVDIKFSDAAIEPTTRERRISVNIEGVDDAERITDKYKTSIVKLSPSKGSLNELINTRLTYGLGGVHKHRTAQRGAPAKRRKIDSKPQKAEQMKVNETIKRSKSSNNASDTSQPVVTYSKVFFINNKTIAPEVCNSNTENDISKQFPSKCVDVIASCSLLDSKNENNKPNIINNSKKEKGKKHLCHICHLKFPFKSHLNVHMRKHTGEKPYRCDICDYRFSQKSTLNTHIKYRHTKEKNYSCHICQYKCVIKDTLNRHLRKHTGDKPYICDICDYRCSEKGKLTRHIKNIHTKEKKYSCQSCQYKCITKWELNLHLRRHTGDKRYVCDICGYRFSEKSSLNTHLKNKHTKEKNYSCPICQYKCVTKGNLNNHFRKHTGDKPYICDICDYRFSQKYNLMRHITSKHTKEKNCSSHICQHKCVTKDNLNSHLCKHTGDKPFICDICDYRFSQKYHLTRHIKLIHTKEKNYSCHICEYKCGTKGNLNSHLRKHTGDKPYKCDFCPYRSSHNISLKSHLISKHKI